MCLKKRHRLKGLERLKNLHDLREKKYSQFNTQINLIHFNPFNLWQKRPTARILVLCLNRLL
ncbi:hypothetical protein FlaCF_2947 [Flavobacterium tructae]